MVAAGEEETRGGHDQHDAEHSKAAQRGDVAGHLGQPGLCIGASQQAEYRVVEGAGITFHHLIGNVKEAETQDDDGQEANEGAEFGAA